VLPAPRGVQLEECNASGTVTLDGPINTFFNSVNDCSGFHLRLLTFARKLNLVKRKESAPDTSRPAKFIESIMDLTESEVSLACNDSPCAQGVPFCSVEMRRQP